MTIKKNNKGNGYIIKLTEDENKQKHKEKIVLKAISECLQEYPGKNINVVLTDDEILINADINKAIEEVNPTNKHHR